MEHVLSPLPFTNEAVHSLNNGSVNFQDAPALFNVDLSTFKAMLRQINIFFWKEVDGSPVFESSQTCDDDACDDDACDDVACFEVASDDDFYVEDFDEDDFVARYYVEDDFNDVACDKVSRA
nr:flavone 6-hydroxylase [Tanacetum cinerariifolium]